MSLANEKIRIALLGSGFLALCRAISIYFILQASNGLVKPGRELEHYPHYDSVPSVSHDKCSVIKTEFAGRPCILKVCLSNVRSFC